jgi:hypothetical protein
MPETDQPSLAPAHAAAVAELREARRLYDAAALIHERGAILSVDSVLVLHKALRIATALLLRAHGVEPSNELSAMAARASELNDKESLVPYDLGEDLLLVDQVFARASGVEGDVDRALSRRYDRAFLRAGKLFGALSRHVDALYPGFSAEAAPARHPIVPLLVALAVGVFVGTRFSRTQVVSEPAPVANTQGSTCTGIVATFFKDQNLTDAAFTRRDTAIDFNWGEGAPPGLSQNDHFSVRWAGRLVVPTAGPYEMRLTSDDGSRLFIDDRPVLDAFTVHTVESQEASLTLSAGLHPIRVEYFDGTGDAVIKLEWRSPASDWRIVSGGDLQ